MYATAIAEDGSVGSEEVVLAVGGELGGGATLLRLAALRSLNQLLSKDLKFGVRTYVKEGRYYYIAATGDDAARLMRILAVAAPSAGGGYLSPKFDGFVEKAQVRVRSGEGSIRRTPKGLSAPSAGGRYLSPKFKRFVGEAQVAVRLNRDSIRLTKSGRVAADLTISEGGVEVKYNVYLLSDKVELQFSSTDRSRAELADAIARWLEETRR